MAEDPLHDIIDSVRSRLQAELGTQLHAVSERHQEMLAAARQQIEADLEQRWAARLDAVKAESDEQMQRLRADADQRATEAADRVRQEMAQTLATEREVAQSRLDAERRTAAEQLEQAREAFDTERAEGTSIHAAAPPPAGRHQTGSLLRSLREIDAALSVSDSLAAIARAAAAEAPRAAVFIANGAQLDEWPVNGLPSISAGSLQVNDPDAGIIVEALTTGHAVQHNGSGCAVPLVLDGAPIGVVYGEGDADSAMGWNESLEAVARYGAAHLGYLTALRTAQAREWLASAPTATERAGGEASARRYARLVVSEVKLYNEAAVQSGRSGRDLLQRLGPEIERARRLYEERVPASVAGREQYFQQELVQTLAGGDPSLLG